MLSNWMAPIGDYDWFGEEMNEHCLGNLIKQTEDIDGQIPKGSIVLIGIRAAAADIVRKHLYSLVGKFKHLDIYDLGNLRKDNTEYIIPLLREMIEGGIVPILFGGGEENIFGHFQAYKNNKNWLHLALVDEQIRLTEEEENPTFLDKIKGCQLSLPFHLSQIGYQSHFVNESALNFCREQDYELLRLGPLKKDVKSAEPLIRDADLMAFHLSAIKSYDAPGVEKASPSGIFSEDACQLSFYAGMSDQLSSFGIYGFEPQADKQDQTAKLMSQMIWYFLEGIQNRMGDFPVSTKHMTEYIVDFKEMDEPFSFWKSNKSGRWWMEAQALINPRKKNHQMIPVSYEEYLNATTGQLPDRLLRAFSRLKE